MQDIVRESGVSAGLVYRYFTGKDDMIAAIVTEWHEDRSTRLQSTSDVESLLPAYLDVLAGIGRPEAGDAIRLSVQVWAEALRSPRIRDLVRQGSHGPRSAAVAAIAAGQSAGTITANLDPDALARILIAIFQGLTLQTAWEDGVDNAAFVRTLAGMLDILRLPAVDPAE